MSSGSRSQDSLPINCDAWCKIDAVESDPFTFALTISNFSSRTEKNGESFNSAEFAIKEPDNNISKWYVEVYPRGDVEECKDFVSVFLHKSSPLDVNAKFVVSTLDANKIKKKHCDAVVFKFGFGILSAFGIPKCLPRNLLPQYAPDDTLTLIFEITIIGHSKKSIRVKDDLRKERKHLALNPVYHCKKLAQDLDSHFMSEEYSDVTISCGEKDFSCHKIILTSRSPVFKTMLEQDMKENRTGRIEIKDMNLDVLEDLLKYIYSGDSPNIDSHAEELFFAADLYQLEDLKKACELKLSSFLDVDNCINLLILGELHQALTLKADALKFVAKNMQKISDWKQSFLAYPNLMAEVLETVFPQKVENFAASDKKEAASL